MNSVLVLEFKYAKLQIEVFMVKKMFGYSLFSQVKIKGPSESSIENKEKILFFRIVQINQGM